MNMDFQYQAAIRDVLQYAVRALEASGIDHARRNAEWILCDVLEVSRSVLYAYPERPVPSDRQETIAHFVRRRSEREPLQYILGSVDFYGLRLEVTPEVLIPRPETEELVEAALDGLPHGTRAFDVGTGSGCIALALKHSRPDAHVWGCDVSPGALAVARNNAERLSLPVTFFGADVLHPRFCETAPRDLHILVSNPPYIPVTERESLEPEVVNHEPHHALFVEGDGLLFYRALAEWAPRLLRPGGFLLVETHADYAEEVAGLFERRGLADVVVRKDFAGLPRMVRATYRP